MKTSRSFFIPNVDEVMRNKIVNFWGNRNAQFTKITEREYQAQRGSLINNILTLKMKKLKTKISISLSEDKQLTCVLNVNTLFRYITSWNRKYWDLELETFESYLLNDDLKEQEWYEYTKSSRKKNTILTLTIMIVTGLLTFYLTTKILEQNSLNPSRFDVRMEQNKVKDSLFKTKKVDKTFTSEDESIQLVAPDDWKVDNSLNEEAILQIANAMANKYVMVLDEQKVDFVEDTTLFDYAAIVLEGMDSQIIEASISEPVNTTINNYPAVQYTIKGEVSKLKISYYVTCIETPETFNQVVAWSLQSKFDDYREEFKAITLTFKKSDQTTPSYRI